MKKGILIIAFVAIGILVQAQVGLKGIKLGSYYTEKTSGYVPGLESTMTSIGGHNSNLYIYLLNNKKVYKLSFTPMLDYKYGPMRLSVEEVNNLIKGLDNNFNLDFQMQLENQDTWKYHTGEYEFTDSKDGVKYVVRIINNDIKKAYPINFWFTMINLKLMEAHKTEEQKKINSDF